ncbi:MAG: transcription antitermination factor NusB [Candidatus Polarisedimenticolaceae bacterium]|nr:transcription antitermination factor NusB [Candidatus Polarisedimenticolaceae bacterium]
MSGNRTKARRHAVQAIYQWQMTGDDLSEIDRQFLEMESMVGADLVYFKDLLHGVPSKLSELDEFAGKFIDRAIESVDPVERAILRMGTYELKHHPEIPYRVVINESVELAKVFGAEQGHRYINGVLDKLARHLRQEEVKAAGKKRSH